MGTLTTTFATANLSAAAVAGALTILDWCLSETEKKWLQGQAETI